MANDNDAHLPPELKRSVYVTNMQKAPNKSDFRSIFTIFGKVEEVVHFQPKNKPRFAFVKFALEKSAMQTLSAGESKAGIYYAGARLSIAPKNCIRVDDKRKSEANETKGVFEPALIDNLNVDCTFRILSHLSLKEKMICEQVCKRWQQLILESFSAIRELDFPKEIPTVPLLSGLAFETQAKVLKRTTAGLRSLDLGEVTDARKIKRLLGLVSPSITHFTFYGTYIEKPGIVRAARCAMPNLKSICISGWTCPSRGSLNSLVDAFPYIEELYMCHSYLPLRQYFSWTNIRKFSLDKCKSSDQRHFLHPELSIMGISKSLEELHVDRLAVGRPFQPMCPRLKKLTFKVSPYLSVGVLVQFSAIPLLEQLTINNAHFFVEQQCHMGNLVTHCPRISKLILRCSHYDCSRWHETFWEQLSRLANLTYLHIDYIPLADVCKVVEKFSKLESLILRYGDELARGDLIYAINKLPRLRFLDIAGSHIKCEDVKVDNVDDVNTKSCNSLSQGDVVPSEPSHTHSIEKICNECVSDGNRPTLELVIARSGVRTERVRWRCGRFIIYNPENLSNMDEDSDDEDEDYLDY